MLTINWIFLIRRHPLSCFSRAIAAFTFLNCSPVNQSIDFVFAGKTFKRSCFVLEDAQAQLAGDSYVECLGSVCHNINVVPLLNEMHRSFDFAPDNWNEKNFFDALRSG
jgi:hypothetical protein